MVLWIWFEYGVGLKYGFFLYEFFSFGCLGVTDLVIEMVGGFLIFVGVFILRKIYP